jgi:hypothetical protein
MSSSSLSGNDGLESSSNNGALGQKRSESRESQMGLPTAGSSASLSKVASQTSTTRKDRGSRVSHRGHTAHNQVPKKGGSFAQFLFAPTP